jgi:hypothetical protein
MPAGRRRALLDATASRGGAGKGDATMGTGPGNGGKPGDRRRIALVALALVALVAVVTIVSRAVGGPMEDFWGAAQPWVVLGICAIFAVALGSDGGR